MASRIPDTDRVSSVTAVTWAMELWALAITRRRLPPTQRVSRKKTGSTATATRVNCHERNSMATATAMIATTLEAESAKVLVTTGSMPLMSWETRDCISPVRVRARKFSDMPRRWS